ncbi:MAG: efflux RND transporter periplasmic adaptor subunit [Spirochaetaceae bacterium]
MGKKGGVYTAILLLTAVSWASFGQSGQGGERAGDASPHKDERSGELIATAEQQERILHSSVAGRLRSAIRVPHTSSAGGTVTRIHVRVGEFAEAGTPLYTIERDESAGSFAPLVVRSRISGIVSEVSVNLYSETSSGETGVVIIDPRELSLSVYLSDKDVSSVEPGLEVEAVDAAGRSIFGTLYAVSPEPDYDTGLYRLLFEFSVEKESDDKGQMAATPWAGRFVRVELPVDTIEGIFIPRELLVRRYGQYYLWTVTEENTLELREVKTGMTKGGDILIRSGLSEGDRYLRETSGRESEGMKVPGMEPD